jgi:hypothetical protein
LERIALEMRDRKSFKNQSGPVSFYVGLGKGEVISSGEYQVLPLITRGRVTRPLAHGTTGGSHTEASESLTTVWNTLRLRDMLA